MQFRPRFDEASLPSRKRAGDQLEGRDREDGDVVGLHHDDALLAKGPSRPLPVDPILEQQGRAVALQPRTGHDARSR